MNTQEYITRDIDQAYANAQKNYRANLSPLAKFWELVAAYHTARLYAVNEPTEIYVDSIPTLAEHSDILGDMDRANRIDSLIYNSHPRTISKNSLGGFGYHKDTPIGYTYAIVTAIAPNVAEIIDESNWETWLEIVEPYDDLYTVEYFSSWFTGTDNLMCKLIDDNGYPTALCSVVLNTLERLENYPLLNEDDFSQRESEQDYSEQIESIESAINSVWINDDSPYANGELATHIWEWIRENDPSVIERNSRGYTDSGYIENTPIIAALYAMGLIDLSAYDDDELSDFENDLIDYVYTSYDGINSAFRGYKSKLQ